MSRTKLGLNALGGAGIQSGRGGVVAAAAAASIGDLAVDLLFSLPEELRVRRWASARSALRLALPLRLQLPELREDLRACPS